MVVAVVITIEDVQSLTFNLMYHEFVTVYVVKIHCCRRAKLRAACPPLQTRTWTLTSTFLPHSFRSRPALNHSL